MSLRRHRRFYRSRHAHALVGACLLVLPLALGGAHPEVNVLAALVLMGGLMAWLYQREVSSIPLTLPVYAILLATAATVLQLMPLPVGLIEVIAPGAHDVLALGLASDDHFAALSMDPPATAHELLKLLVYLCGALFGLLAFDNDKGRRQLLVYLSAAGSVVAAVGLLHGLAFAPQPYGVFGAPQANFVSTFVNPNHLAGFVGLCSFAALGAGLMTRSRWRWIHIASAVLCGAGVFLSLSRGGILSFVTAWLFLGVLLLLQRSGRKSSLFALQVGIAATLVLASYLAHGRIVHELWTLAGDGPVPKFELWSKMPAVYKDFPILGVGRGAFFAIFPRYWRGDGRLTFTHLENEWLQVLVDWGLVGAVLLAMVAVAYLRILRRARGSVAHAIAATALLYIAMHNSGDFNLELTGIALPVVLLLTAFAAKAQQGSKERHQVRVTVPRFACSGAVLASTVLVAGWLAVNHSLDKDTARLGAMLSDAPKIGQNELEMAKTTMARHPADYILPLLLAERLQRDPQGARQSLHWVNRGMLLTPGHWLGHRLAGRALLRLGARKQGLLEYRLASEGWPSQSRNLAQEVWRATGKAADVATIGDSEPEVRLAVARFLLSKKEPGQALRLLGEVDLANWPEGLTAASDAYLANNQPTEAERAAAALEKHWPERPKPYLLQARAATRRKDPGQAARVLERGIEQASRLWPLFEARAVLALQQHDTKTARQYGQRMLEQVGTGRSMARAHWMLGRVYQQEGRLALAIRSFEAARGYDRRHMGYRIGLARARLRLGDDYGSQQELNKARVELGSTPALEQELRRVNEAIAKREDALRFEQLVGTPK